MIKQYLSNQSLENLKKIAEKLHVPWQKDGCDTKLISLLSEALEEYIKERQILASDYSQNVPKKYYLYSKEYQIIDFLESRSYESYSIETGLTAVLKDPSWFYVHWNISQEHLHSLKYNKITDYLGLRITYDQEVFGESGVYFDILIENLSGNRYISLPFSNAVYWVDLFLRQGYSTTFLSRSTELRVSIDGLKDILISKNLSIWKVIQSSLEEEGFPSLEDIYGFYK